MSQFREYLYKSVQSYVRYFPINKGKQRLVTQSTKRFPLNEKRLAKLRFNDIQMECDLTKHIQKQLFFFGEYEREESQLWVDFARDSSTIFDIGANVGLYSLLAASVNSNAFVYAFEPTPMLQSILKKNILINEIDNIIVNPVAVSDESGDIFLNTCTGGDGSNEGMNFVSHTQVQEVTEVVQALTIDDYCQQNGIETIDLMKMDIEGGEFRALLGAQKMLVNKEIRIILMELIEWAANRSGSSCNEIKQLLFDSGYKMFSSNKGEKIEVKLNDNYQGNVIVLAE